MVCFFFLLLPLPLQFRRVLMQWLSTSPLVARVQYALKVLFLLVLILFMDALNRSGAVASLTGKHAAANSGTGGRGTGLGDLLSPHSEVLMRRFYAQRNVYLCGFTLFLSLYVFSRVF
jgi:hypothetical protein